MDLPDALSPIPPTLADVAQLAGVSAKTVARALNGEAHVRPETRERIMAAAAALRFRPNRLARDLRKGSRSGTVALVIGGLDNPFYSQLAAGVDQGLRGQDLPLLIASTDDDAEREAVIVGALLERRVSALLLVPVSADHGYLAGERQLGTPVVFLDRPPVNLAADTVLWDDRGCVHEAVARLAALGHRRIGAVVDSLGLFTARDRLAAFREGLERAGVPAAEDLVVTHVHDVATARAATARLLAMNRPPTALLTFNNRISVGAVDALVRARRPLPIIGFDDFDLAEPLGLSIVQNDPRRMGLEGVRIALHRMASGPGRPVELRIPSRLVLRGSERLGPGGPVDLLAPRPGVVPAQG